MPLSETSIFITLMLAVTVHAAFRGGAPERLAGVAMLAGTALTVVADTGSTLLFRHVEWPLFWIDTGVFAAFLAIALRADRFWPLWLAALQFIAVAAHGARGFDPQILPVAYWWLVGKLSYPMILILCIGVERHQARLRHGYAEKDWSRCRAPAVRDGPTAPEAPPFPAGNGSPAAP